MVFGLSGTGVRLAAEKVFAFSGMRSMAFEFFPLAFDDVPVHLRLPLATDSGSTVGVSNSRHPGGSRVRQWNSAPRTMPSSTPRMAEKITSQTSETDEEPSTQLTLTRPVLAITSAIRTTSKATATPA